MLTKVTAELPKHSSFMDSEPLIWLEPDERYSHRSAVSPHGKRLLEHCPLQNWEHGDSLDSIPDHHSGSDRYENPPLPEMQTRTPAETECCKLGIQNLAAQRRQVIAGDPASSCLYLLKKLKLRRLACSAGDRLKLLAGANANTGESELEMAPGEEILVIRSPISQQKLHHIARARGRPYLSDWDPLAP